MKKSNTKDQQKEYLLLLGLTIILFLIQPIIKDNIFLQFLSICLVGYIIFSGIKLFKSVKTYRKKEKNLI